MAQKTIDEIKRDLKNKIYHPVYLLQGDEPYYIDAVTEMLENSVLDDMEKEFNQTVLYGKDCEILSLISAAKRYPMMSNYQVVIIKEAQEIKALFPKAKSKSEEGAEEKNDSVPLLNYLTNPLSSTLLVLAMKYKSLDKRGKLYKVIEKNGVVFESKKMYDDKLPKWIENYLAEKNSKISPKASQLMSEHLGNDLSRIANECDKLLVNIKSKETIDVQHIELYIGVSKEFNIFELQKALGKRDVYTCIKIANYFTANPKSNPIQVTMAMLYTYFTKILLYHSLNDKSRNAVAVALKVNPFFVDDYFTAGKNYSPEHVEKNISLLREFDLKSKGVGASTLGNEDYMKEFVYKLIH
ncbi:MAG: DNA polymerase III subunit delta [Bacteroidia bacterium]|jgi:DNA polymerase-3 subunit delta|nr:DNA polymerase III subunit delta [Bacteroidota bacterium]MBP6511056.1 DNA polymerase III subunit delta [Bacteroidia bacterium]MBP7243786.1 DNA polymerase III subunit delta [Bacteroidia bacterium]